MTTASPKQALIGTWKGDVAFTAGPRQGQQEVAQLTFLPDGVIIHAEVSVESGRLPRGIGEWTAERDRLSYWFNVVLSDSEGRPEHVVHVHGEGTLATDGQTFTASGGGEVYATSGKLLVTNPAEVVATRAESPLDSSSDMLRLRALIQGHLATGVVGTLARLRLVDRLDNGPQDTNDLAAAVGVDPLIMTRLLRAAAFLGILEEVRPGIFAPTTVAAGLRADGRGYRELAIALTEPGAWRAWERFPETIVGSSSAAAGEVGRTLWEHFEGHPEEAARFAAAMGSLSARHSESVLGAVDPSRFRRIVDVGGSEGVLLQGLLMAAVEATGVLFDLPDTIEHARKQISESALARRVELVGGDFFDDVPPGGDLYVVKNVLLDWDDEQALRILANCHAAAAPGATIWVIETLLPEPPATSWVNLLDVNVLALVGGRNRTLSEYQALLDRAGFDPANVTGLIDDHSLIEATKR